MLKDDHPLKRLPSGAVQHVTAGPYSPVLEIKAERLVVLSGQVAVDLDGRVIGASMEEQAEAALANCGRQLATAGCGFSDVFKVNVYLADLSEWSRFNAVYKRSMPAPLPVRTAVQAILLDGFRVEIEMWAVKPDGREPETA
jgi:2-iminobutanoate/2-iminopropanoate deaminase